MEESIFPPSPIWYLPRTIASREDGSAAYGSKNNIVILKNISNKTFDNLIINNAHEKKVTAVLFSPFNCDKSLQNVVASCSEDGFVKLWKIDTLRAFIGHKSHWENKETIGKIICLDWSVANPHIIVSAADNNSLVLWDVLSNSTVKFSFQKPQLSPTIIACCPHNEKLVAVGVKSGLIYIIQLTKSGKVIYRLRGHDNEIQSLSWCPMPYNVFRKDEIYEEFLLASTCQNKEIFIWRAGSDGKCETKIHMPTGCISKKDNDQYRSKLGNTFSLLALFWQDAYSLYLSSNFGELLLFDVKTFLDNVPKNVESKASKQFSHCFKVIHYMHSKGLYAIAGVSQIGDIVLYENIEIKSELKFKMNSVSKIIENFDTQRHSKVRWNVNTPESKGLLWTVGQDRKLVACTYHGSKLEIAFNLHTFNGTVYSAVTSPHDCNKIAIAAGDGVVRLWNLLQPASEIQMFWQKIKDRVMSVAWHPTKDGLLAYGTSKGRVGLIDTSTNKMPKVFKPSHPDPIYSLSWGPQFGSNDVNPSTFDLYCTGNNTLSVYDCSNISADSINLTKLIPFQCKKQTDISWKPDYSVMAVGNIDGTICLVEPPEFKIVHTLSVYKNMIQSIAWHPLSTSLDLGDGGLSPFHTYFTAGSTDKSSEIRVFNCTRKEDGLRVEQVASLRGHHGFVRFVSWSPHLAGRLVSTSADGSVQIWDVTTQTPLVNFTSMNTPMFSIWSPINPDAILTGFLENFMCVWKISKQTETSPLASSSVNKQKKTNRGIQQMSIPEKVELASGAEEEEEGFSKLAMAEVKCSGKPVKESKMFSTAWRDNSKDEFEIFYSILKGEKTENSELNFSLPFLLGNENYTDSISSEEEKHKTANNWTEYYELSLWNGKIKEVIEEKIKTGQLNDFLVSLAPTVSPRLWQEACISYSKSLAEKQSFRKAATYLVACHRIYEAISLLKEENLFLECLCLAKSRLPKSDPIFVELIREYAEWLFKNGSYLRAGECYIYLNDYLQVAKICGKKSQPEYLALAALAARKCGSEELEFSEATNALVKCLKSYNFELGQRICDDHPNLKYLRLMLHVYRTIHQLDEGKISLTKDILTHVKSLTDDWSDVIFPPNSSHLYQKYKFYTSKEEVLVVVTQEISSSVCSKSPNEMASHLIRALSASCRYIPNSENESDLLFKMSRWLFGPSGLNLLSGDGHFEAKESLDGSKVDSLREFEAAAIVRNLISELNAGNGVNQIEVLLEYESSFLNEDSFRYFRNLVEVEACEKRLTTNLNNLTSVKLSSTVNGEESAGRDRTNFLKGSSNGEREEMDEMDKGSESQGEKAHEANGESEADSGPPNAASLEKKVLEDRDALTRLRGEIERFEETKISSPYPVPVFCSLKKICQAVPESATARILLENLEKKWLELNKESR